jgi:hypothetical protein
LDTLAEGRKEGSDLFFEKGEILMDIGKNALQAVKRGQ